MFDLILFPHLFLRGWIDTYLHWPTIQLPKCLNFHTCVFTSHALPLSSPSLPMRYPAKIHGLIFGGLLTWICSWSVHLLKSRLICHTAFRSWLYISILRSFGANAIGHLHTYLIDFKVQTLCCTIDHKRLLSGGSRTKALSQNPRCRAGSGGLSLFSDLCKNILVGLFETEKRLSISGLEGQIQLRRATFVFKGNVSAQTEKATQFSTGKQVFSWEPDSILTAHAFF